MCALDGVALGCVVLGWVGLAWVGLGWVGSDWVGLDRAGSGWVARGRAGSLPFFHPSLHLSRPHQLPDGSLRSAPTERFARRASRKKPCVPDCKANAADPRRPPPKRVPSRAVLSHTTSPVHCSADGCFLPSPRLSLRRSRPSPSEFTISGQNSSRMQE